MKGVARCRNEEDLPTQRKTRRCDETQRLQAGVEASGGTGGSLSGERD